MFKDLNKIYRYHIVIY